LIKFIIALITGHKVEWLLAKFTFPGYAFVSLSWWKAFRLMTMRTHHIATLKATVFALTDRSHTILIVTHNLITFEAKEVVEFVSALVTFIVLKQLERKFMTEYKEICITC
jgi:hypothetical protein